MHKRLGIDVGATGIKAAIVDTKKGTLLTERKKYPTPKPATPQAITEVLKTLIDDFDWVGKPIGVGFPSIIKNGITLSAANIDSSWIDFPIVGFLNKKLKCAVEVVNDADAAGLAERHFGIGKDMEGLVIFLTLGTGIGSALFFNGQLLRNTELGHLKYKEKVIEKYASNSARENKKMSWKSWGKELNSVLHHIDLVLSPDHIILGGGISKKFNEYKEFITLKTDVQAASLQNNAGIIGAAMAAPMAKE